MYGSPFTSFEEVDIMTIAQAQHQAESEADYISLTREEDNIMATPKKLTKKPATAAAAPAAKKATTKAATESKRGPRATPEGYIGLNDLAKEFKTTAGALRRKLRNSEIEKPEGHGWNFKDGSKELAAVRKLLSAKEAKAE